MNNQTINEIYKRDLDKVFFSSVVKLIKSNNPFFDKYCFVFPFFSLINSNSTFLFKKDNSCNFCCNLTDSDRM